MMNADRQTTDSKNAHSGRVSVSGCCGGPAPAVPSACCAKDAAVKSTGGTGCGCGSVPNAAAAPTGRCCS